MKPKGGARAGAGRKSLGEERSAKALALLGVSICTKALNREGEFKDLDMEVLLELASKFAVKAIPQKIEGEGFETRQIVQVYLPTLTKSLNGNYSLKASSRATGNIPSTNGS